jgi:hypothetical protein
MIGHSDPGALVIFHLGALRLSVSDTLLVFVGIPAAVVLVIAGLALVGRGQGAKRYRPGRPFDFTPVWFLSSPEQLLDPAQPALPAGVPGTALTSSAIESSKGTQVPAGRTGGASDRW